MIKTNWILLWWYEESMYNILSSEIKCVIWISNNNKVETKTKLNDSNTNNNNNNNNDYYYNYDYVPWVWFL